MTAGILTISVGCAVILVHFLPLEDSMFVQYQAVLAMCTAPQAHVIPFWGTMLLLTSRDMQLSRFAGIQVHHRTSLPCQQLRVAKVRVSGGNAKIWITLELLHAPIYPHS